MKLASYRGPEDDPDPREGGLLAAVALVLRPAVRAGGGAGRLDDRGGSAPGSQRSPEARLTGERAAGAQELLLIRRAASERDPWSGQMALPGGRRDPGDRSLLDTAIRETREETEVDLSSSARLRGRLSLVTPRTPALPPLTILPFVFTLTEPVRARPRAGEIAEVLWVPTVRLRDPAARSVHHHLLEGVGRLAFPAFEVEGRVVWGLTHRILEEFLSRTR